MSWHIKDTLERFEYLLKEAKKIYKLNAEKVGTYYSDSEEITQEELELACTIIKNLGNVIC